MNIFDFNFPISFFHSLKRTGENWPLLAVGKSALADIAAGDKAGVSAMHNDDEFQDANGECISRYRQLSVPYPLISFDVILDLQPVNGARTMIYSMMKREERRRSQQVSALLIFMQSPIITSMLLQASRPFSSSSCGPLKSYHHS
jgi:hypothetical protein